MRRVSVIALLPALFFIALPLPAGASAEAPASGQDGLLAGIYSDQWQALGDLEGLSAATGHTLVNLPPASPGSGRDGYFII